jgi:hypothetical protein
LAGHVAKQGKFDSDFFGEGLVGRGSVDADAEDRGFLEVDLAGIDTRLVCLQFLRSTTGKGKNVKGQDDVLFAAIVAQLNRSSLVASQGEIGSHVSDFEESMSELGLRLLRPHGRRSESRHKEQNRQDRRDSFCHFPPPAAFEILAD